MRSARVASTSPSSSDVSRECRCRIDCSRSLGLLAEHREQDEILLARCEPFRSFADVLGARRILVETAAAAGDERHRARDGLLDRRGRRAVGTFDQHPELVQDRAVATGGEDVEERLRGEDLADRRRERRPAGLGPDAHHLGERVEQAITGGVRAEVNVESCDKACRKVVFGGANGDARRTGATGWSPMCSSTRSHASQSGAVSTPVSRPRPWSASTSDSPETRWSVSASG